MFVTSTCAAAKIEVIDAEKNVVPSQSKLLHDALIKNGIDSTYYIVNGADHYAAYFYQPKAFGIIVDFLNRTLR